MSMKIYGDVFSGNCYKLKLACSLLSIRHEWIPVDILKGETRSQSFLELNPNGQIPVCITDESEVITESNAILYFLARDSQYWPDDRLTQTRVLQWMFFEQYTHEPTIAVARFIKRYLGLPEERRAEYESKIESGHCALRVMEQCLREQDFLVAGECSIADISLYAYTHVAPEGGFDLSDYRAIQAWMARMESIPGYVSMDA